MNPPNYEALDCHGHAYVRPAQVVCELPTAAVKAALESATQEVAKLLNIPAKRRISFGTPTFEAFGLICEKREAEDFVRFTNCGRQPWIREGEAFFGPIDPPTT